MFGLKQIVIGCLFVLGAQVVSASAVELEYDAFVGPAHAGTITVAVERDEQTYHVRGKARSKGLMELLKDLKGWFSAKGHFEEGSPRLDVYEYYQKDNSKERYISVANGELKYVKNGQPRRTTAARACTDLVTALWVLGDCTAMHQVHTGRSGYAFELVGNEDDICRFRVQEDDEDEEPFELDIQYGERMGVRVPVSIRSTGGWAGRLVLNN